MVSDERRLLLLALADELWQQGRPWWRRRRPMLETCEDAGVWAGRAVRRRPELHRRVDDLLAATYLTASSPAEQAPALALASVPAEPVPDCEPAAAARRLVPA